MNRLIKPLLQALLLLVTASFTAMQAHALDAKLLDQKAAEIERQLNARLGVTVLDTQTGRSYQHRQAERFPLNSTFKVFACAALLAKSDAGQIDLQSSRQIRASDIVTWSPVTKHRVGGEGMSLFELCTATMTYSDNTAANFVLKAVGGPAGLTAFFRSLGDHETRIDRYEPDSNRLKKGDQRDTTTPEAVLASFQKTVLGDVLSNASKEQLLTWLKGNTTAKALIRKDLPQGWIIGDRSGANRQSTRSLLAVIWPPQKSAVVVAIYLQARGKTPMKIRNAAIAEFGRTLVEQLTRD